MAGEKAALLFGHDIDQGEHVGLGEAGQDLRRDPLGAVIGVEPLVHQGDPGAPAGWRQQLAGAHPVRFP